MSHASSSPLSRSRATTLEGTLIPESQSPEALEAFPDGAGPAAFPDTFVKKESETADEESATAEWMNRPHDLPEGFDELPIELISLTDRFVESLSAKVWPHPPSIERLSTLFQDFYVTAASRIDTHISTLSSRQHRFRSPGPSVSSRSSSLALTNGRAGSTSSRDKSHVSPERTGVEQQMLTSSELEDRRNARRLLEKKRVVLEEAVERRACEGVYDRIWRHRSSNDEEQDEKLRSKTAALALVGIGIRELGIEIDAPGPEGTPLGEEDIREWLTEAREELIRMNDERYPLGKLLHLKAAHKNIVDSLSRFHPSSSSADEILPMLIYTLITTPAEGINIISNFLFVQRFRMLSKIDGEAAYCLTNLEAAISFLETVDLASLRADEAPTGPPRTSSGPSTPNNDKSDPLVVGKARSERSLAPEMAPEMAPSTSTSSASDASKSLKAHPSPSSTQATIKSAASPSHQRRLSFLLPTPTNPFSAAGDAVMNRADQGLKTVSSTLENSYRFLFGKLEERQLNNPTLEGDNSIIVPKTLDDARRLMSTDLSNEDSTLLASSILEDEKNKSHAGEAAIATALHNEQGKTRDRSVDSTTSGHSAKRVNFAGEMPSSRDTLRSSAPKPHPGSAANPAVESMRNLGNTLNPLNRFSGINMMRPFGRTVSNTPPALHSPSDTPREPGTPNVGLEQEMKQAASSSKITLPEMSASISEKKVQKMAPPIQKFLDLENPGDLKIGEALELLRDYRRLAGVLKDAGAY
ncbi:MAG: hypothetical protein M4579_004211 [Chaenotheca gracillima]|nr:MAG: hypothetical protein M4579_004211 [Chaenotheca gracillima]